MPGFALSNFRHLSLPPNHDDGVWSPSRRRLPPVGSDAMRRPFLFAVAWLARGDAPPPAKSPPAHLAAAETQHPQVARRPSATTVATVEIVPPDCAHTHGHGNMDAGLRVLDAEHGTPPDVIFVEGGCEITDNSL